MSQTLLCRVGTEKEKESENLRGKSREKSKRDTKN